MGRNVRVLSSFNGEEVCSLEAPLNIAHARRSVAQQAAVPEMTVRFLTSQGEELLSGLIEDLDEIFFMSSLPKEKTDALRSGKINLVGLSSAERGHRDIVIPAVSHRGIQLEFASDLLKDDPEVVQAAVCSDYQYDGPGVHGTAQIDPPFAILRLASERLQSDPEMHRWAELATKIRSDSTYLKDIPQDMLTLQLARMAVLRDASALQHVPEKFRIDLDPEALLCALRPAIGRPPPDGIPRACLDSIPAVRWRDYGFCSAAVEACATSYEYIGEFKRDRHLAKYAMRSSSIQYAPFELRADHSFALSMVTERGKNLEFVGDALKADPQIVLRSLRTLKDGRLLRHAATALKNDRNFALDVCKLCVFGNGRNVEPSQKFLRRAFRCLSDEIKDDEQVVTVAVKTDGLVLRDAGERAKQNYAVVHHAVCQNALALHFVSPEVRELFLKDGAMLQHIVQNHPYALPLLPRHALLSALSHNGLLLKHLGSRPRGARLDTDDLRADAELLWAAIMNAPKAVKYIDHHCPLPLRRNLILHAVQQRPKVISAVSDTKDVLYCIQKNGLWLEFLDGSTISGQGDITYAHIVEAAIRQNFLALQFAGETLRSDVWVLKQAISSSESVEPIDLTCLPDELLSEREVVLAAVKRCGTQLKHASMNLRDSLEIVQVAVEQDGLALQYAGLTARETRHIVRTAVRQNGLAIRYAGVSLRTDDEIVATACDQNPEAFDIIQQTIVCMEGMSSCLSDGVSTGSCHEGSESESESESEAQPLW
eukprot:TRINITY_DN61690_c0_g1_i1.p1 TRINITY_DN61690_c0_g1~~TRINITY_DN61690_c0_g1_i1.p1  ORF type:complete len:767 (-),score=120.91 TRINITY_DN61690_c0_g1_i1:118-2418(-)